MYIRFSRHHGEKCIFCAKAFGVGLRRIDKKVLVFSYRRLTHPTLLIFFIAVKYKIVRCENVPVTLPTKLVILFTSLKKHFC